MNATIDGTIVTITLSRRNLLALLQKVDLPPGESHCMLVRVCDSGQRVVVRAEPDDVHYTNRPPGAMRDDAEQFIERHETEKDY